jgi:prepilin-type N-terminal cleavage/methylation domain-containing protein
MFKKQHLQRQAGFTFVEMMVVVLLTAVIFMAGFILFTTGHLAWAITHTKIYLQENLRRSLERVAIELSQSGRDSGNALKVSILDNSGVNSSDILRFSIPLCLCGTAVMDSNNEVKKWGAPLAWGQSGCQTTWTLNAQNKVTICHLPPGNPNNPQTIDVALSAVNAHLAHGDWIGSCANCDPNTYTNLTVEYLLDANNQFLRRVLDTNGAVVNSTVIAQDITDFQAGMNTKIVTLTMQLSKKAKPNKTITLNGNLQVILRNYD